MPDINDYDNEEEWMGACITEALDENPNWDEDQAVAMCSNVWNEHKNADRLAKMVKEHWSVTKTYPDWAWEQLEDGLETISNKVIEERKAQKAVNQLTERIAKVFETKEFDENMAPDDDTVVSFGSSVKAMGEGLVKGQLVVFADENEPDLEKDFFDKATDYGPHEKSLVFYNHGIDEHFGKSPLKNIGHLKVDDTGVWMEHQLDMRDEYEQMIYELAEQGKLGLSSGTAPHLIERERKGSSYHIKKWYLGIDASYTPTPAEPKTGVMPLKSFTDADQKDSEESTEERKRIQKELEIRLKLLELEENNEDC